MACCGYKCSKYMLAAFIIILMFIGMVIIAAAAVDINTIILGHGGMKPISGFETDAVMIAVGLFIIIVATFGCYGLWKESSRLLNIFACCIIAIIFMELSLGIASATLRPKMEKTMKRKIRLSYIKSRSGEKENAMYKEIWDHLHRTIECCGSSGPYNYQEIQPSQQPPFSCCPLNKTDTRPTRAQRAQCLKESKHYKTGCEIKLLSNIHRAGIYVIVGGIVFSFFEMVGIILAPWVAYTIRIRDKKRADYPNSSLIQTNLYQ